MTTWADAVLTAALVVFSVLAVLWLAQGEPLRGAPYLVIAGFAWWAQSLLREVDRLRGLLRVGGWR